MNYAMEYNIFTEFFMDIPQFHIDKNKIHTFCKKHHIKNLALFGSVLTSHFTSTSDIDILVNFETEHTPTLFDLVDIEDELENLVGRHVDLKTPNDLSPYFRDDVLSNAKMIYGS